jgi:hypothetical protein
MEVADCGGFAHLQTNRSDLVTISSCPSRYHNNAKKGAVVMRVEGRVALPSPESGRTSLQGASKQGFDFCSTYRSSSPWSSRRAETCPSSDVVALSFFSQTEEFGHRPCANQGRIMTHQK